MRLNPAQIEKTLQQFQAKAVPAEHPAMSQLERLFGEHTYFLDGRGLNIVEPTNDPEAGGRAVVVTVASWANANEGDLEPHPPQETDTVLELDLRH
jgi:hypothetical protein